MGRWWWTVRCLYHQVTKWGMAPTWEDVGWFWGAFDYRQTLTVGQLAMRYRARRRANG